MLDDSIKNVIHAESKELNYIANNIDYSVIEKLLNIIQNAKGNIFVTGCGTSAMAARKIVHTMQVVNKKFFYLNPSDAVHGALGTIDNNDIVIMISKGGNTNELCSFVKNIKMKNAYLVYVGEDENSTIGKNADLVLKIKIEKEPDAYNMLATASTLAVISVFDAMAIYLEKQSDFSQKIFLENHPSGAVGDRLSEIIK